MSNIPTCPFCWGSLSYPQDIRLNEMESVLGGRCFLCGARFIVDPTGKNVGEAMVQALRMVAKELGKDITMLIDGEDYEDCVLAYDLKMHTSLGRPGRFFDGYARLYVIRAKRKNRD